MNYTHIYNHISAAPVIVVRSGPLYMSTYTLIALDKKIDRDSFSFEELLQYKEEAYKPFVQAALKLNLEKEIRFTWLSEYETYQFLKPINYTIIDLIKNLEQEMQCYK